MNIRVQRFGSGFAVIGDESCYDWSHPPKLPVGASGLKQHAHSRASQAFIEAASRVTQDLKPEDVK